jgi:hypothetical protein
VNTRRDRDHIAHHLDAATMSGDARQMAAMGPTSIAVHDDRDVFRKPSCVEVRVKLRLPATQTGWRIVVQSDNPQKT